MDVDVEVAGCMLRVLQCFMAWRVNGLLLFLECDVPLKAAVEACLLVVG